MPAAKVVFLPTNEAENFRVTADAIEKADHAADQGHHPELALEPGRLGRLPADLERIVQLAHERGIFCCWTSATST